MIFTGYILLSIFISAVSLMIGFLALIVAVRETAIRRSFKDQATRGRVKLRQRDVFTLSILLLVVGFGLRILSWPLYYLALDSAIPHVSGAMCMFGVTRLHPLLATFTQLIRPLMIIVTGGWLFVRVHGSRLESQFHCATSERPRRERMLFWFSIVLLIIDASIEIVFFMVLQPNRPVDCCGSVYDLPDRLSAVIPSSLFGSQAQQYLLPALFLIGSIQGLASLLAGRSLCMAEKRNGSGIHGRRSRRRRNLFAVIGIIWSILFIVVSFVTFMEVVTPALTGLPDHHCLYCLVGKTNLGPVLAILFSIVVCTQCWGLMWYTVPPPGLMPSSGKLTSADDLSVGAGSRFTAAAGMLKVSAVSMAALLIVLFSNLWLGGGGFVMEGRCAQCDKKSSELVYLTEIVTEDGLERQFCSIRCAIDWIAEKPMDRKPSYVTVRDEQTGVVLDSGAAWYVEFGLDTGEVEKGDNPIHSYQFRENAYISAFDRDGVVIENPFDDDEIAVP